MSPIEQIRLNTQFLSLIIEGEQGIVFHHQRQSLFHLSSLSLSFFLAYDECHDLASAAALVSDTSRLPNSEVLKVAEDVLPLFEPEVGDEHYLDARYPEIQNLGCIEPDELPVSGNNYLIHHSRFCIICSCSKVEEALAIIAPCRAQNEKVDFHIDIVSKHNGYDIYCNREALGVGVSFEHLMPMVIERMQVLAFQHSDYLFCFHGAVVRNNRQLLFIPGVSGAGKSTLTAELALQGFQVLSDEMIVLDRQLQPIRLNLPMAIKSGSWSLFDTRYPELQHAQIWTTRDGRELKYLWPNQMTEIELQKNGQVRLLNPCFQNEDSNNPMVKAKVTPLSVIDSISVLSASGYQVHKELTLEILQELIRGLSQMQRDKIHYSSSEQILKVINPC